MGWGEVAVGWGEVAVCWGGSCCVVGGSCCVLGGKLLCAGGEVAVGIYVNIALPYVVRWGGCTFCMVDGHLPSVCVCVGGGGGGEGYYRDVPWHSCVL